MLGRLSTTTRVGLALVLTPLAVLAVWIPWYFTRSWEPVNLPLSLRRGHIHAEFDVNVPSTYTIDVVLNFSRVQQRDPCPGSYMGCDASRLGPMPWSIWRGQRRIAAGEGEAQMPDFWIRPLGAFQCDHGHYVVDLDAREDRTPLDFYEPHLVIYESAGKSRNAAVVAVIAFFAFVTGAPVGFSMVIIAGFHRRQGALVEFWKKYALTQPGSPAFGASHGGLNLSPPRLRRRAPRTPYARFSTTSLILVLTLLMVWLSLIAAKSSELRTSVGLPLHLIRPGVAIPPATGMQPLLLRIVGNEREARYYIGSELVRPADLDARLKHELGPRPPDWPVYVEGDPDVEWRRVAQVIDAVRGAGANVVLVPGSKH